jgi:hypothetical protein
MLREAKEGAKHEATRIEELIDILLIDVSIDHGCAYVPRLSYLEGDHSPYETQDQRPCQRNEVRMVGFFWALVDALKLKRDHPQRCEIYGDL